MQFPESDAPVDTWLWSEVSQSGAPCDYVAFLRHAYEVDAPVMQALERAEAFWDAPESTPCWPEVLRVTEAAALSGDTRAIGLMARWAYLGVGRPADEAEAVTWLERGAQADDPRCTLTLARHLVRTDPSAAATQAAPLFERAAALGLLEAHSYWAEYDPERHLEHLELGASQSDPTGLFMLALHLKQDKESPESRRRACELMRQAADRGSSQACLHLAFWYRSGEQGLPVDQETAIDWLRVGIRRGNLDCMTLLARMLLRECEGRREEALQVYTWAAIRGDGMNQACLGDELLFNGRNDDERIRGVYWLRKAAESGYTTAYQGLGMAYGQGLGVPVDLEEAVRWFLKGALSGDALAQCSIGAALMGGAGVERDPAAGHEWFQIAALQNNPRGLFLLGLSFEQGDGTPKDLDEAHRCYLAAAKLDHPSAAFKVGENYLFGTSIPQRKHTAVRWLTKAARLGSNEAKIYLGVMLKFGDGVKANAEQAARWFREAAEDGEPAGMRELGLLYLDGEGVAKNRPEAIRLLCEAAERGDGEAQDWVKRLGVQKPAWLERLVQGLPMAGDVPAGPQSQEG